MNDDKIINAAGRFNKSQNGTPTAPVPPTRLTPTLYRVNFKDGQQKEVIGYLGVSPLFVAITDEREKILFMLPHGDYAFVEAVEDAVNLEADYDIILETGDDYTDVEWAVEDEGPTVA